MAWRWRSLQIGVFLVVLTPFGLSIAAQAWPTASNAVAAAPRPSLRFGEYLLSLGEIEEGERVRAVFRFENRGDSPLTITEVKPSCGCLTPELPQKTYAPGERGLLLVYPHTTGAGSDEGDSVKEYYIDVSYEAGDGPRSERVHVKFILPERRIIVEPKGLMIYQGNTESTRREITVIDRRATPAVVKDVRCKKPGIGIEWTPAVSADDALRATISVTIPPAAAGEYATLVEVHFEDPNTAPISVPIIVKAIGRSERTSPPPLLTPVP